MVTESPKNSRIKMDKTVAYLGPKGTFTEKATDLMFPTEDLMPLQPIRRVVMAVEQGTADIGVVPFENFYNGPVIQTLDSLIRCKKVRIIKEKGLNIVHCLGALPEHKEIERVYSKDQALEQCDQFLSENYYIAEPIAVSSTAEAAEIIKRNKDLSSAAIAPKLALLRAGLEILAEDLCPNNSTRFIGLDTYITESTGDDKTILAIHPPIRDRPGVLADCLNIFGSQHINLECIYSRPDGKKGYVFYVELNGHEKDGNIIIALDALKYSLDPKLKHPDTIKVLGSFPNSHWKDEEK